MTESEYFQDLRVALRSALVHIEVGPEHGGPLYLVQTAVARRRSAARDVALRFDEVWCVFDVDEHPYLADAINQANANDIRMAVSNPSFELWALLHFQDQTAHVVRQEVRARLQQHLPGYDKHLPTDLLFPRYSDARQRARHLDTYHQGYGGTREENPSSAVWELVDAITEAARRGTPQPEG